jgi:hypothetical protein
MLASALLQPKFPNRNGSCEVTGRRISHMGWMRFNSSVQVVWEENMTPYGWIRGYVALWMSTFLVLVADARAQGPISAKDLAALPQADRVAVMKASIERRIDKVQNIDVTSVTRSIIRKYDNGRAGDLITEAGRYEYRTPVAMDPIASNQVIL